jgi:hypothetical protein
MHRGAERRIKKIAWPERADTMALNCFRSAVSSEKKHILAQTPGSVGRVSTRLNAM